MNSELLAMLAEAKPGYCALCDEKIAPQFRGRPRKLCASPDCKRLYMKLYVVLPRDLPGAMKVAP